MNRISNGLPLLALVAAAALAQACGGSSGGGGPFQGGPTATPAPTSTPSQATCEPGQDSFASTWDAVQKRIFERNGCAQDACHGSGRAGGLGLAAGDAYGNLVGVRSSASALSRVEIGDEERSFLWLKLAAATRPGSYPIAGSPMPIGRAPISEQDLELLRLWIYAGAPEEGVVNGTQALIDACLPDPEPIAIAPLPSPAPAEGFQLAMPEWELDPSSEFEGCFATYYDVSDQVPAAYLDETGTQFAFGASEVRQDPQSHHVFLYYPTGNFSPGGVDVYDPAFGEWTCRGGSEPGTTCDPKDESDCGSGGLCASELKRSFGCIGYGPSSAGFTILIGGAGQPVSRDEYPAGVYGQLPTRGVIYWNSHAFNLTAKPGTMHVALNYEYTAERRYVVSGVSDFSAIFRPNAAPYTRETYCNDHVLQRGTRLFSLSTHTHKRGKHTWITLADGTQIYDNYSYTDPVQAKWDPALAFDSPDPSQRILRYCGTYENGIAPDGSPDPETVTRLSKLRKANPSSFGNVCKPVACTAGRIAAPCDGENDDAACDSSPGAGDGECDACPITGGESTENEMFNLFGLYWVDPAGAGG
ncbi:MAG: hypothetical protein ACKPBU_13635 [Alphaproteobacteria bacterium]